MNKFLKLVIVAIGCFLFTGHIYAQSETPKRNLLSNDKNKPTTTPSETNEKRNVLGKKNNASTSRQEQKIEPTKTVQNNEPQAQTQPSKPAAAPAKQPTQSAKTNPPKKEQVKKVQTDTPQKNATVKPRLPRQKDTATSKTAGNLPVKKPAGTPPIKRDSTAITHSKVTTATIVKRDSAKTITARVGISQPAIDSARLLAAKADSIGKINAARYAAYQQYQSSLKILRKHPYYPMLQPPVLSPYQIRQTLPEGKEIYFYTLAGVLLLFAGFRSYFSKYFNDLLTLFFRRSLKQRQLEQQLAQISLPAFLFNTFFVIAGSIYLALLIEQLSIQTKYNFWQLLAGSTVVIIVVYLSKFLLLKLLGWLFRIQPLTNSYIFLIFLINKILTVGLLPFIILIALGTPRFLNICWTLSWIMIAALFAYRFIVLLRFIQKTAAINFFYFLLYFVVFEIFPIMAIYQSILFFLN